MPSLRIKNARPLVNGEFQGERDVILNLRALPSNKEDIEIDAKGKLALPALFALGVDFQEPARDDAYSFADGFEAMRRGGFSGALCESAANPIDDLPKLRSMQAIAAGAGLNINFLASFSVENEHKNISEMLELSNGGAFGFGDGNHPVGNLRFLRMALEYGRATGKTFYLHPLEPNLTHNGTVNEGLYSDMVGFKGIPEQAETIAVYEILELSKWFDTPVHLREISCAWSLSLIEKAKRQGVKVTCDVGIYHLLFDDSSIATLSSDFRFNSPLRTAKDREHLWKGLLNGIVDKISVNHFPVRPQDKQTNFEDSIPGAVSLEVALSALWDEVSKRAKGHPEKIFDWMGAAGQHKNAMQKGMQNADGAGEQKELNGGVAERESSVAAEQWNANADMILFDPELEWIPNEKTFAGAVCNSPLLGKALKGKIVGSCIGGEWKENV